MAVDVFLRRRLRDFLGFDGAWRGSPALVGIGGMTITIMDTAAGRARITPELGNTAIAARLGVRTTTWRGRKLAVEVMAARRPWQPFHELTGLNLVADCWDPCYRRDQAFADCGTGRVLLAG